MLFQISELNHVNLPVMLMPDDFKAFTKIRVDNHMFNKSVFFVDLLLFALLWMHCTHGSGWRSKLVYKFVCDVVQPKDATFNLVNFYARQQELL